MVAQAHKMLTRNLYDWHRYSQGRYRRYCAVMRMRVADGRILHLSDCLRKSIIRAHHPFQGSPSSAEGSSALRQFQHQSFDLMAQFSTRAFKATVFALETSWPLVFEPSQRHQKRCKEQMLATDTSHDHRCGRYHPST